MDGPCFDLAMEHIIIDLRVRKTYTRTYLVHQFFGSVNAVRRVWIQSTCRQFTLKNLYGLKPFEKKHVVNKCDNAYSIGWGSVARFSDTNQDNEDGEENLEIGRAAFHVQTFGGNFRNCCFDSWIRKHASICVIAFCSNAKSSFQHFPEQTVMVVSSQRKFWNANTISPTFFTLAWLSRIVFASQLRVLWIATPTYPVINAANFILLVI